MNTDKQPTPNTDGRLARGAETRKQILKSAISSIATRGLSNTTLDRVAEVVGVSRALVVFHFKSKNRLYTEVLEYLGKQYSDGWDAVITATNTSPSEKLLELIDYDVRFACENREYISTWHAFWGEARGNMLYHEVALPRDNKHETQLEHVIERYMDSVNHDKKELVEIRDCLASMLFGIWVISHLEPRDSDYESGMRTMHFFLEKTFPQEVAFRSK